MSKRSVSLLGPYDLQLLPGPGIYEIDAAHTEVEFVARHLMIAKVRGRFKDVRGQITIAERPEDSHVEVVIAAASLDTGNRDRDTHLRSGDFFAVDQHPTITFRSTSVRGLPDDVWELVGDLTIRAETRPVVLDVEFDAADVSPLGEERIGFRAMTEVNREDFGLTWNAALERGGVLIGRDVGIELAVQATAVTPVAA